MADAFTLTEHFNVTPERIYKAWLDAETHSAMTGSRAESESKVGGTFTAWDGYISGRYLILDPNRHIVMIWRTSEFTTDQPDSRLELSLAPDGKGTILTLVHTNLPTGTSAEYEEGWRDYYFVPMQEYFTQER